MSRRPSRLQFQHTVQQTQSPIHGFPHLPHPHGHTHTHNYSMSSAVPLHHPPPPIHVFGAQPALTALELKRCRRLEPGGSHCRPQLQWSTALIENKRPNCAGVCADRFTFATHLFFFPPSRPERQNHPHAENGRPATMSEIT